MKYALEVWSNDVAQVVHTCRVAEDLGFDAFYYGESPTGLNLECWSVLAALAGTTRQIRLGPVIANVLPGYRSLVLLAKQAGTLALLSDGRCDFRTGVGASGRYAGPWWRPAGVPYPSYPARLAVLEDALPKLRALWAGRSVALSEDPGEETFALGFACPPIPVTVAGISPRAMDLAARHADIWEASYQRAAEFDTLAGQLDAPPGKLERGLEIDVFVAGSSNALVELEERLQYERGDQAADVRAHAIVGLGGDVPAQLAALESAGVDRLLLAFHDPHDHNALEVFARAAMSGR